MGRRRPSAAFLGVALALALGATLAAVACRDGGEGGLERPPLAGPHRLAITDFADDTDLPRLASLPAALSEILITDLGRLNGLEVIPRADLQARLGDAVAPANPAAAAKLGRELGANVAIYGRIWLDGGEPRLAAQVVETASGEVRARYALSAPRDLFFALEKELAEALVVTLGIEPTVSEKSELRRYPSESITAWLAFGEGVVARDAGDRRAAEPHFRAALAADPGFVAAAAALDHARAAPADGERAGEEELLANLDPSAADYGERVQARFAAAGHGATAETLRQKIRLLHYVVDRGVPTRVEGPGTTYHPEGFELLTVAIYYALDPEALELLPEVFAYVFGRYPADPFTAVFRSALDTVHDNRRQARAQPERWRDDWQRVLAKWTADPQMAGIPQERQRALALFAKVAAANRR